MSNTTIIAAQIDVCEIVFNALSPQLPEDCAGFIAALDAIDDRLTADEYEAVHAAALAMMCYAQQEAFRLGWALRGKMAA